MIIHTGLIAADLPAALHPVTRAWIVWDAASRFDRTTAGAIAGQIQSAGYEVDWRDWQELTQPEQGLAAKPDLLVVTQARTLPYAAVEVVQSHLRAGGDIIALGVPAWQDGAFRVNHQWLSQARYQEMMAQQKRQHSLFDFDQNRLPLWTRQSDRAANKAIIATEATDHGLALHVVIDRLTGWDTLASPPLPQAFPAHHTLTCFRAKGGPRTRQLALEWREQDGSRWIATVDLQATWKQYALTPDQFIAWQPPAGRAGKGDHLRVDQANQIIIGLAFSHTAVDEGPQEYWLDDLGTAPNPLGDEPLPVRPELPHWETLSPGYLFYPVSGSPRLATPAGLALADASRPAAPFALLGMHPRPRGAGFAQARPWRWQPLLEAWADEKRNERAADQTPSAGFSPRAYRGAIAALMVHSQPPFQGGIWAGFTPSSSDFYAQREVLNMLGKLAERMRHGCFLLEGGCEYFTAFENQSLRLGAKAANFGKQSAAGLSVKLTVREIIADQPASPLSPAKHPAKQDLPSPAQGVPAEPGTPIFAQSWPLELAAGQMQSVETSWKPARWPANGYRISVELLVQNKVIDCLAHDLHVWQPNASPQFITAKDGGLWLKEQPWKAHGVNYMPSSGLGVAHEYFEYWLGKGAYDPEVIERDLRRIKDMNLNAVSVFIYYRSLSAQHLLDFLRRSASLDLRVNLSLRPGTPLNFRWPEMKALLEYYRLAQNDTVFAYDLAWEPSHYDYAYQKSYASDWSAWLCQRYGSISAAEKAWGVPAPTFDGRPSEGAVASSPKEVCGVPLARHLTQDGPWRKCVADYRAFLDDLLRDRYAAARRLVQSVDSHHPVSFRMQLAGDPTFNSEALLPYDFYGLAGAVDIWEPEAYGRIGDWEKVKAGLFTAAYARLCDPAKPLIWAEMGTSVWDMARMAPHPDKLAFAARFYTDFYRLLRESGADGIFFWWYPGGYRLNEKSDFGIINPDGTDRAVTQVIRVAGPRFITAAKPPPANVWIPVARDADARGLFGIYEAVEKQFWQAIKDGQSPGLKWRHKP